MLNDKEKNAAQAEDARSYVITVNKTKWITMLAGTFAVAGLLSPWASSSPDGLERVAEDHGFLDSAKTVLQWAPIPDYEVAGLSGNVLKVGSAGVIGVLVMMAALWVISRHYGSRRDKDGSSMPATDK